MKFSNEQLESLGCKKYNVSRHTLVSLFINDFELISTCQACPEQYDIVYNGYTVGYFRLRGGKASLVFPDVGGDIVYQKHFADIWKGCFDDDFERSSILSSAITELEMFILHKISADDYMTKYLNKEHPYQRNK